MFNSFCALTYILTSDLNINSDSITVYNIIVKGSLPKLFLGRNIQLIRLNLLASKLNGDCESNLRICL